MRNLICKIVCMFIIVIVVNILICVLIRINLYKKLESINPLENEEFVSFVLCNNKFDKNNRKKYNPNSNLKTEKIL